MKLKNTFYIAVCLLLIGYTLFGITTSAYTQEHALATPVSDAIRVSAAVIPADSDAKTQSIEYEKQADAILSQLAGTTDPEAALKLAGSAIDYYKKALDLNKTNDRLVHKYCKAIELKYNLIIPDGQQESEKQKVYADTLSMLEQLHPGENNSVYADYDMALFLILNAQYYIIFQVIGTVNRIHDLCEKIYKEDRSFENYSAAAALGRINFLAPNILFLIGWPDKNLSRQYLEEALKANPDSILVKFFLAETLYSLGEKDKAIAYYKQVVNAEPRHDINYFQDKKTQRNCAIKMKELGIQ
jgi:tetratricopeptide (TPR) repeat protein